MSNTLAQLFLAHLAGDFLLQNEWMQAKTRSSFVCSVHVAAYMVPFLILFFQGHISGDAAILIAGQHWLQDRFSLHLAWMRFFGQTPPDKWTIGPLCIDQSFHLVCIAIITAYL